MNADEASTWTPLSTVLALSIVHRSIERARDGEATTDELETAMRYVEAVSDAVWWRA